MANLFLMPNLLGGSSVKDALPENVILTAAQVKYWLVENEKAARRFLMLCGVKPPFEGIRMFVLNKHTGRKAKEEILNEIEGHDTAVLSEAGCPAIADPGNDLVMLWRKRGGVIKPLVGPSSVLLALIASGFNGQSFSFHGYLPIQKEERIRKIRELESEASKSGYTQLFIETPFRNEVLFSDLLKTCKDNTFLCIALDLTLPTEEIRSHRIGEWKKQGIGLKNRPAVFSLWAEGF